MKPWRANPTGKKSGFGKTNKGSCRANDHLRSCRVKYNQRRSDLENAQRKLRRHIAKYPKDLCARASFDRQGFK